MNKIIKKKNGANFYRCDLHVHTPCSSCYEDKSVSLEDIIRKAKDEKIDLLGILDHNDVGDIETAIKIGKREGVFVMPGVEITSIGGKRGIHILALFDASTKRESIIDFLTKIGIDAEKRGKENAISNCTPETLISHIKELKGLCIAAHADSSQGILDDLQGNQRISIVQNEDLNGIELVDVNNAKFFDGTDPNYKRFVPCIQSSDAHAIKDIGRKVTRLKMDKPCLEGIRQAFLDPESRIKFDEEEVLEPYPQLIGMPVKGGFLDDYVVKFNPNLNCLIGGRGTGKSTNIELIRYALNILPELEEYKDIKLDMVKNLLGRGEICLLIKSKDGDMFRVERKYGEDPRVYDINDALLTIQPSSIVPVVVFGETELEKISYDSMSQLSIIDNFSEGINELLKDELELTKQLKKNRDNIDKEKIHLAGLEQEYLVHDEIEAKIKLMEKHNFDDRLKKQKLIEDEKSIVSRITRLFDDLYKKVEIDDSDDLVIKLYEDIYNNVNLDELPNTKEMKSIHGHFSRLKNYFNNRRLKDIKYIDSINGRIKKLFNKINEKHARQEKKTIELFKELESEGIEDAGKNYLELQTKKSKLNQVNLDIQSSKKKIKKLYKDREIDIKKLIKLRNKIHKIRDECAKMLSDQLGESIDISVIKNGNKTDYSTSLRKLLKGSGVRRSVQGIITEKLTQFEFVDLIQKKDQKNFGLKTGITEGWCEMIFGFQPLFQGILSLQEVLNPDLPLMSLKVGDRFKPINQLSLGQKCTTLLSLAMIESDLPLIIDTPEEGLNNEYIYDNVVQKLRDIKEQRQVILATHNPNIPVSGDSELIICMNSDGENGWVDCFGSIDNSEIKDKVQDVLEGGKDAFLKRKKKYGY